MAEGATASRPMFSSYQFMIATPAFCSSADVAGRTKPMNMALLTSLGISPQTAPCAFEDELPPRIVSLVMGARFDFAFCADSLLFSCAASATDCVAEMRGCSSTAREKMIAAPGLMSFIGLGFALVGARYVGGDYGDRCPNPFSAQSAPGGRLLSRSQKPQSR